MTSANVSNELDLGVRIDALEQSLRKNRIVAAIGVVLALLSWVLAAALFKWSTSTYLKVQSSSVNAMATRTLILVDDRGEPRARFGAVDDGNTELALLYPFTAPGPVVEPDRGDVVIVAPVRGVVHGLAAAVNLGA